VGQKLLVLVARIWRVVELARAVAGLDVHGNLEAVRVSLYLNRLADARCDISTLGR